MTTREEQAPPSGPESQPWDEGLYQATEAAMAKPHREERPFWPALVRAGLLVLFFFLFLPDEQPWKVVLFVPVFLLNKKAPGGVSAGNDIVYDFDLYNNGGAPATGAVMTDRIPANTQYVVGSAAPAATFSNNNAASFTYVPPGAPGTVDPAVTHVRFTIGTMAAASQTDATFTVRVNVGTPIGTVTRLDQL